MLGRAPVTEGERAVPRGTADLDSDIAVADDRSRHVAATVQIQDGVRGVRLGGRGPFGRHAADFDWLKSGILGDAKRTAELVQSLAALRWPDRAWLAGEQGADGCDIGVRHYASHFWLRHST